jgi:superfamily II DNA/RNA helicase
LETETAADSISPVEPTFAALGLSEKVLAALTSAGYVNPTPIQAQAIPVAMTGRDVLGIAQTGTGKTASFVLPMIARLESGRARARMPRSLILAPTRELAAQVAQSFEKYGVNHKLDVALLIGGVSMDEQVRKLDRGVDVLIATPGRLLDHFGRGRIMLMGVEILVIDEADRMLDMGFIPDIEKICKLLPPRRQTLFFSATMPPEITRLVDQFLKDPTRIEVAKPATTAKTITQRFVYCASHEDFDKRELLRQLIRGESVRNAIIFCNRKRDVAILLKSLQKHGFNAGALHGDMDQTSRTATLDGFREGKITFLAASDVAARGLDIPDVSHVFNFDIPWQSDDYVHRIGRTGRAGKQGAATTIVTQDDFKALKDIQGMLGEAIEWIGAAPTDEDITEGSRKKRGRGGRAAAPAGRGGRPGTASPTRTGFRAGPERAPGPEKVGADGARARRAERSTTVADVTAPQTGSLTQPSGDTPAAAPPQHARPPRQTRPRQQESTQPIERAQSGDRGQNGDRPQRTDRPERSGRPERRPRPQRSGSGDQPTVDSYQPDVPIAEQRIDRPQHIERHARRDEPRGAQPQQPRGNRPERSGEPVRPTSSGYREDRRPRPERADRDDGKPAGFGDSLPAFLRKPAKTVT